MNYVYIIWIGEEAKAIAFTRKGLIDALNELGEQKELFKVTSYDFANQNHTLLNSRTASYLGDIGIEKHIRTVYREGSDQN